VRITARAQRVTLILLASVVVDARNVFDGCGVFFDGFVG
jgi:hypothetical protein